MSAQTQPQTHGNYFTRDKKQSALRAKLVKRASKGDRKACVNLCREIAPDILLRARLLLGRGSDAEDVAQEVLLRVCKSIQNLRQPKAFGGWLNSIVVNEARRCMKKTADQIDVLYLDDYPESMVEENEEYLPQEHLLREDEGRVMMEIIATLPNRQREAIMLHYYESLGVTEVAKVMDIPHQNVSKYLKLGRDKIREEIQRRSGQAEGSRLGALSALPVSAMLTQTFDAEATQVLATSNAWVQNAVEACSQYLTTVPAAPGSSESGAAPAVIASIVASSVVVPLMMIALLIGESSQQQQSQQPQANDAATPAETVEALPLIDMEIVFTSSTDYPYLNPSSAIPQVVGQDMGVQVLGWTITEDESDAALYSSENSVLEDVFIQMRENGEKGEDKKYILTYTIEDVNGNVYEVSSYFQIRSEGAM